MTQPLLTIAIPTYNRADILDDTLKLLLADPACDDRVEIVVSDNASPDNTTSVVAQYPTVRYYRNRENIGIANFTIVMGYATGGYIRLMNDTARFSEGALGRILAEIEAADFGRENLIFVTGNKLTGRKERAFFVDGKNEFIGAMSYFITWIGNFGMWREDFENTADKDRFVATLMQHIDWAMSMADNGKPTKIVVGNFLTVAPLKKKGQYDIFDTFVTQYFKILKFHRISRRAFAREKYRLLRYFLLNWYFTLKNDKEYNFDTSGSAVIYRRYWYEPYFWPLLLIKAVANQIKTLINRVKQ